MVKVELKGIIALELDDFGLYPKPDNKSDTKLYDDNEKEKKFKFIKYDDEIKTLGDLAKFVHVEDLLYDIEKEEEIESIRQRQDLD